MFFQFTFVTENRVIAIVGVVCDYNNQDRKRKAEIALLLEDINNMIS